MNSLRGNNKIHLTSNYKDIKFQVVDWTTSNDDKIFDNEEDEEKNKYIDSKEYIIRAYGVLENGSSISLNIYNFPPHFYINVPEGWAKNHLGKFISFVKSKLSQYYKNSIIQADFKIRKKFWGFTNNQQYKFARIMFKNTIAMNQVIKILSKKIKIPGLHNIDRKYELYESNIQPFIRFMHINDLKSSGWIQLKAGEYTINDNGLSNCQIDLDTDWEHVKSYESNDMAPFITASFDIEADSSHGDFPLAKKDYKKLANDILEKYSKTVNAIKKYRSNGQNELSQKYKNKIENRVEYIFKLIKLAFDADNKKLSLQSDDYDDDINYVFTKCNLKPELQNIQKVAIKVDELLDYNESYRQLSLDIITKYNFEILDLEELTWLGIDNPDSFEELINDAFADNDKTEHKTDIRIYKVFTKNDTNQPIKI